MAALLQLASEIGLSPKRVSSTHGGEYHSACPACGGKDRFFIQPYWEGKGRYRCRQCGKHGDAIQFCRDFLGMDYPSACAKLGVETRKVFLPRIRSVASYAPKTTISPREEWQSKAKDFVLKSHQNLMMDFARIQFLQNTRGLSPQSIQTFLLGWNPADQWVACPEWGMPQEFRENGYEKRLWLPKGIVIPSFSRDQVNRLKIRRSEWKEGDEVGKYIVVSGGGNQGSIFGDPLKPIVVLVEAELDAMLVVQEVGDQCCCITMGGLGYPDASTHAFLLSKKLILFALDFDEPGKKKYRFWESTYRNVKAWPVPIQKSPCDAYLAGTNLRKWVLGGIQRYGPYC